MVNVKLREICVYEMPWEHITIKSYHEVMEVFWRKCCPSCDLSDE